MPWSATALLDVIPFDRRLERVYARACCACQPGSKRARVIVLTGAQQLGKTELLTSIRARLCEHVTVLPDVAKIVFQAGFSTDGPRCLAAAQRAIYHLQRELEQAAIEDGRYSTVVCEGGSLDGLVRWPLAPRRFFSELGTTRKAEFARYAAVIHLRQPCDASAERQSQIRASSPHREESDEIDARISEAWSGHPHFHTVDAAL